METSIARQLARIALSLHYEALPGEVVQAVKAHLYDTIGCAFGGFHTRDVQIVRRIYRQLEGTHEATLLVSGERLPAVSAALVNALAIRARDYNDFYTRSDTSRPSDLIAVALAAGELVGATMKAVIVAIVVGYEIEQRMSAFAQPGLFQRKWHPATLTQFVSPLVAGRLMGLTEDQLVHAVSIAGSHSHTIGAPATGKLTMLTKIVTPLALRGGIFAALLAQEDFTGPEDIFEGEAGFMAAHGGEWHITQLIEDWGDDYKIMDCAMKAFPTDPATHSHLTAAIQVISENDIQPDDVQEMVVTAAPEDCDRYFGTDSFAPASREVADQSLPYCLAHAILERAVTLKTFDDEQFDDPRWKVLIGKITSKPNEAIGVQAPAQQPSHITVTTTQGETYTASVDYPKGDPRHPMTAAEQDSKFEDLTAAHLTEQGRQRVKGAIFECETLAGVHQFMALMAED